MRKLIFTLVLLAATAASASTLSETVEGTFDVRSGASFSLENTNGRVNVTAWDQPRIHVVAVKTVDRLDSDEAKTLLREVHVDMRQRGDSVVVKTEMPSNRNGFWDAIFGHGDSANVHYDVSVPRSAKLDIDDTNGRVTVTGVDGPLKVETTNGRIELHGCSGSVDLSSTNGAISAELLALAPSASNRIETTNGRIEITMPSSSRAEVDASTTNGRVETAIPITTRTLDRNELHGSMNGGGPALKLRTTNGSIRILAGGAAVR